MSYSIIPWPVVLMCNILSVVGLGFVIGLGSRPTGIPPFTSVAAAPAAMLLLMLPGWVVLGEKGVRGSGIG